MASAADVAEEHELVARCRAGDPLASRDLYRRHFDAIHRLARRLGTPPAELDDVTQEVFASAFSKIHRFGGGNFGHWIRRICANAVNDLHRRRRVREAFAALTFRGGTPEPTAAFAAGGRADADPEAQAERRQAERQVATILSRMRPKQREVFVLFELERLAGEEIAALLGCPLNTVWTRLFHARKSFVALGRKRGFIPPAHDPTPISAVQREAGAARQLGTASRSRPGPAGAPMGPPLSPSHQLFVASEPADGAPPERK